MREELAARSGVLPKFEGFDVPSEIKPQLTGTGGAAGPPLTQADKTQFTRLFVSSNPINGLLPATQAQSIFLKSGLPTETLAQIWNLADTQQRGALDLPDFVLAMYYIQGCMSGAIPRDGLPGTLPGGLYEVASGGRPRPAVMPTSPVGRQVTGLAGSPTPSLMARQMTGQGMQPQRTGQSFTAPQRQFTAPPAPASLAPSAPLAPSALTPGPTLSGAGGWDITPAEKRTADQFYEGLDTMRRGFVEGDQAVGFMMQSGLPEGTLAQIW